MKLDGLVGADLSRPGVAGRTSGEQFASNIILPVSLLLARSPLRAAKLVYYYFAANLSHSIFICLKIRIDVHIALSYRYLLHIKDRTGRSQRSILHQLVV